MNESDVILQAISELDFSKNELKDCGNGLFLTNYEIDVLSRYGISIEGCCNLKEVLFKIEDILNDCSQLEDLERVSLSIAERDYYFYSNK